jgi:hypothetical protein
VDPTIQLEHDLRIILAIQSLRAFGYGFASVVLGAALANGGLSDSQVGLVFASILAVTRAAVRAVPTGATPRGTPDRPFGAGNVRGAAGGAVATRARRRR